MCNYHAGINPDKWGGIDKAEIFYLLAFIMTDDEFRKMYSLCRLRSTLEAFAIRQWREKNKTTEPPEKVIRYLEELRKAASRSDFEEFYKIDALFHRELILSISLEPLVQNWDCVVAALSG